jgi:cytochrome c oxidase cbb3-type subunit III
MDLAIKSGEELFQVLILTVLGIFTLVLLVIVANIYLVLKKVTASKEAVDGKDLAPTSWWSGLTDAVPLDKEDTVMLDHNYDGIRELDNHLPPWWKALFYMTIVFAVVYMFLFHFSGISPLMAQEYEEEMAVAKKQVEEYQAKTAGSIDEKTVKLLVKDATVVERGKTIFTGKCAACHGQAGEGGVGPNLTDEYWLHGGSINDVFKTIKFGVPEKGMISWKATLKPNEIQDVSNYILAIQGTKPANAKAPQGEKMTDLAAPAAKADSTQAK